MRRGANICNVLLSHRPKPTHIPILDVCVCICMYLVLYNLPTTRKKNQWRCTLGLGFDVPEMSDRKQGNDIKVQQYRAGKERLLSALVDTRQ
jgi:hypothetical protein